MTAEDEARAAFAEPGNTGEPTSLADALRASLAASLTPLHGPCSTCRDTGKVECAEPDGSGLYDQACPDCDAPYPVTGDPDAEDPFAPARQPEGA